MKRECFDTVINKPFEFIEIPVPSGYDAALIRQYGDCMKMIRGASAHGYPFFSRQKEYMEKHRG